MHSQSGDHDSITASRGVEADDDLMMRFKGGDAAAFEVLYDRYEVQLFGLCLRLLGSRAEAQDALQEAFAKVVDRRDSFEPRGSFRSWIFTIVRFACMDRLRVAKTEQQFLERMDASDQAEPHESEMLARTDVDRLLMLLPVDQREVLVLHRLHGFSQAEIAVMLGGTEAGVRQKSYRALKALRARVAPIEEGE